METVEQASAILEALDGKLSSCSDYPALARSMEQPPFQRFKALV